MFLVPGGSKVLLQLAYADLMITQGPVKLGAVMSATCLWIDWVKRLWDGPLIRKAAGQHGAFRKPYPEGGRRI